MTSSGARPHDSRRSRWSGRGWLLAAACAGLLSASAPASAEFIATEADFQCVLNGVQVAPELFRIFHRDPTLLADAIAQVQSGDLSDGLPEGTIIQLTPSEAMVKRGGGFNPFGGGWEFFRLRVGLDKRTRILARGSTQVTNNLGIACMSCHVDRASSQDFVVGMVTNTLPFIQRFWTTVQQNDRRCAP